MSKELIFVLLFFWLISATYVMHWHYKRGNLSLGTILLPLFFGPILALFINDSEREIKKRHYIEQNENDTHRRWFRTMGEINRQRIPGFGRTIPPPPPYTAIEPPNRRPDNKLKDFKFLRNDK
jgi:hypothetical protein